MRRGFGISLGLVIGILLSGLAVASDEARLFMDGTAAYRKGDWPAAIEAFEALAGRGIENGRLFYNLGNAYLKNEDVGHALLWYERALRYIPEDPDLTFNYEYALTLTKDERGEQTSPLLRILFFWKYQLSPDTIRWIALVFNALLWVSLGVLAIRSKPLLRPSIILAAAVTLILTATATFNYIEADRIHHAIILQAEVPVRSGFTETATQLFVLHAGTKVRVERQSGDYLLIRYTEDKIGWVNRSEVGVI